MVKADIKRDYYADLGIDPKAEEDEIRKKYRKLALKFHPDRNPGKELEYNAKFQAIQAAYEILIDSKERLKYDTGRLRAGYGKFYCSSKTNMQPPRPQYPQPNNPQARRVPTPNTQPRTTPNPSAQSRREPTPGTQPRNPPENTQHHPQGFPHHRGSYPTPPSAGAQKYSSYAKSGSQKWDKIYEDTRTRADAFRGFHEMKPNANPGGWSGFDPRTGRPNASTSNPQTSRRQSAYETYFNVPNPSPQRAQAKKKQGFAPGTPGGDEPMAQNTSAYASFNKQRASYHEPHFEPAPSPTAKKWPRQEESTDTNIPNLQRTSCRYATTGGEKTYVSGAGLGRSSSTRDSPFTESDTRSRTNPPSPTSPQGSRGRHRSASPKFKSNRERTFPSSPETSDSDEIDTSFRPKRSPRSRKFGNNVKGNIFSPFNPDPGEDTLGCATRKDSWLFDEPHIRPDGSPGQTPRERWNLHTNYENPQGHHPDNVGFAQHDSQVHEPSAKAQQTHGTQNHTTSQEAENPSNNSKKSDSPHNFNMYGPSHKPSIREWSRKWGFTPSPAADNTPKQSLPLWAYPSSILPQLYNPPRLSKEAGDRSPASQNMDGIPRDGNPTPINPSNSIQINQTTIMSADSSFIPSFGPFTENKSPVDGTFKSRNHENIDVTFSASDWNGKFQHAAEFLVPRSSRELPSQSKPSRSRGRSISRPNSANHPRPFPPPGSSNQNPQENINKSSSAFLESGFSVDKWTEEVLKSNIWTMPHNELPQRNQKRQKSPRKQSKPAVNRPPTIPKHAAAVTTEAEEADTMLSNGDPVEPQQNLPESVEAMDIDDGVPNNDLKQQQPAPFNAAMGADIKPATAAIPTTDGALPHSTLNLKNLTKVAPFTPTNSTGINDLNDLSSTLPFESRPDDSSHTRLTVRPQDLTLPKPPRVPAAPNFSTAEHANKAEIQTMWERYVADVNAYMHDWNIFNRTMLGHFNARQHTVETGLAPNWVCAVGNSTRLNIKDGADSAATKSTDASNGVQDGDEEGDAADEEQFAAGSGLGGFNAYFRGVKEDFVVRQHWEIAWERHLECLEALDATRRFMRSGGKNRSIPIGGATG
ncbi:hypothetical protein PABG_02405 [Paracoccidioides brasiliensis Pb03]|nr:hypothetical protein PABG_02405 [Paracoccidioides brasiliensis Pb03]